VTAFVELRTLVAGALTGLAPAGDDWPVHEAPVDSVTPPCFALVWPDPWVTPQTVCTYTARLDVIVFGARIDPAPGYEELEELVAAVKMWRDIFRGEAPVKKDTEITNEDIKSNNLILWGDPSSNVVLRRLVDRLPIKWTKTTLEFRGQTHDPKHYAPILIFPNPLNPKRYVVINSGIDFRNDAYGSNALQTPKLPDWAIIDLDTPTTTRWPGKIAAAGFFDEQWK
jgi:hypothetical protein